MIYMLEEARRQGEALRLYWAHQIKKARYEAQRAERQYTAGPGNRVVARELERVQLEEIDREASGRASATITPTIASDC